MSQLSEAYGRRPIFLYPFALYTLTQVGSALAPNTATLLIFRFLGGFFAAAPLTNSGYVFHPSRFLYPIYMTIVVLCSVTYGTLRFAGRLYRSSPLDHSPDLP